MTPYPACPVPFTTTLTRLAGVGMLLVGFAFCILMIATTPAQAASSYRADEYEKATHHEHIVELGEWESWAGRRTLELVEEIAAGVEKPRQTHRGRIAQLVEIFPKVSELRELSYERANAAMAAFCSDNPETRSIVVMLNRVYEAAENVRASIRTLEVLPKYYPRRTHRMDLERQAIGVAMHQIERLEELAPWALVEANGFYIQVAVASPCEEAYGTEAFDALRERLFYAPSIGWPLAPKEE